MLLSRLKHPSGNLIGLEVLWRIVPSGFPSRKKDFLSSEPLRALP